MPTLNRQLKTDLGMLPQSQALEAPVADTPRVGPKRAGACAAVQHCRGERRASGSHPRASGEYRGVSHSYHGASRTRQNRVFVLSKTGHALMPCHPARARKILRAGRARIVRLMPFTIRIVDRPAGATQRVTVKVDPGSKTTRTALVRQARELGLPVATATGGRTKFNRCRLSVPKAHMLDAACVGDFDRLHGWQGADTLQIKSTGRGAYQRTRVNASGFPRGHLMRATFVKGLRTGDLVTALVPKGKYQGRHTGRVAVRRTGSFNITTANGLIQGISFKHCRLRQRADGYQYQTQTAIPPHPTQSVEDGVSLPQN